MKVEGSCIEAKHEAHIEIKTAHAKIAVETSKTKLKVEIESTATLSAVLLAALLLTGHTDPEALLEPWTPPTPQ